MRWYIAAFSHCYLMGKFILLFSRPKALWIASESWEGLPPALKRAAILPSDSRSCFADYSWLFSSWTYKCARCINVKYKKSLSNVFFVLREFLEMTLIHLALWISGKPFAEHRKKEYLWVNIRCVERSKAAPFRAESLDEPIWFPGQTLCVGCLVKTEQTMLRTVRG